jgi:hypothetical protein
VRFAGDGALVFWHGVVILGGRGDRWPRQWFIGSASCGLYKMVPGNWQARWRCLAFR